MRREDNNEREGVHNVRSALNWVLGLALAASVVVPSAAGAQITPAEILERIDANMTIRTARTKAEMSIQYRDGDVRKLVFESWAQGTDQSFLEFISPARDAGSRFLRRGDG